MSLRVVEGEEECFEYDCQDEERKSAREQNEAQDLLEEGKCWAGAPLLGPLPMSEQTLRAPLFSLLFPVSSNFKYQVLTWELA